MMKEPTVHNLFQGVTPIGTAVDGPIRQTFLATSGLASFYNSASATEERGSKYKIYAPEYIRLVCITGPGSSTDVEAALALDVGNRYASGADETDTFTSRTPVVTDPTDLTYYYGPLTLGAATGGVYTVGRFTLRGHTVPQPQDEYIIDFSGKMSGTGPTCAWSYDGQASVQGSIRSIVPVAPVLLYPNWSLCLHVWGSAMAGGGTWEIESVWRRHNP
jgi:hypothetical protein